MTIGMQFCVDLETVGIYDNAVITRIAVTPFDLIDDEHTTYQELVDRTLYLSFDQEDQLRLGREIEPATKEWWETQSEELKTESYYPTDNDLPAKDVLLQCKEFLKKWKYDHYSSFIWARNCGFEGFKLQRLNNQVFPGEKKQVFNNWNWHEVKTFNHIMSGARTCKYNPPEVQGFVYHAANHDASADAYRMIRLWNGVEFDE